MSSLPSPLESGTLLNSRYELVGVLGQGGFGITYLARVVASGQQVVIKELAPADSERRSDGTIRFPLEGPAAAHRLRSQFEQESRLLQKLRIRGLVRGLDAFQDNATSYLVMEHIEGAIPVDRLAQREGRMSAEAVLALAEQILETLAELHGRGYLHRDLKPSNMLVDASGHVTLIDLGSAREWAADLTIRHTVLYTPGFAPIEQLSETARRGPGTDFYGLGATLYLLLTGHAPGAPGESPTALRALRPDIPLPMADAIEACLALRLEDRPASAAVLREMLLGHSAPSAVLSWHDLDRKRLVLSNLKVGKNECPHCGDVLSEPKPLKAGVCFVCREGRITRREFEVDRCPCCKHGILRKIVNGAPLAFSPSAPTARLVRTSKPLPWVVPTFRCEATSDVFEETKEGVRRTRDEAVHSWEEWRQMSRRAEVVWQCESCAAQLDDLRGGMRELVYPAPKPGDWQRLFPEEWARVARGLEPGSGNAACERCSAEYFYEGDHLTLLDASRDPYHVMDGFLGRLVSLEQARWIGGGKMSGRAGLSCVGCGTEFDREAEGFTLVATPNERLESMTGQTERLVDWRRLALDLPRQGDEPLLDQQLDDALRAAYADGEFEPDEFWRSKAHLEDREGTLVVNRQGIEFGGLWKKQRILWSSVREQNAVEPEIWLVAVDDAVFEFVVRPKDLQLKLDSGRRTLTLNAYDLAERVQMELRRQP